MISKRCSYALKAVLALAKNYGGAPMTIQHIAASEHIPPRFLEAILRDLKQEGLTDSIRGKDGGYLLASAPQHISMGSVVRAVEGAWLSKSELDATDVFANVWEDADHALQKVLDQKNFLSLVQDQAALHEGGIFNYTI